QPPHCSLGDRRASLGARGVGAEPTGRSGRGNEDIDWQIWIENGPQPTPWALVITYKTQPSQPQFTAVFSDWDFAPRIDDPVFTPELTPGTEKIRSPRLRQPSSTGRTSMTNT